MYGSVDNIDPSETLDRFVNTIKNFLFTLGENFGLSFYEEIDIYDLVTTFQTLLEVEYYLDHDQILRAIEAEDEPLETLANIFEIVSNLNTSWTFSRILSIEAALLTKIRDTHYTKSVAMEDVEPEQTKDDKIQLNQINNLKLYREFTANDQLVCFKLIRRGHNLDTDFKTNVQYIRNHLEFAKPEDLVTEIVGILYFSSDTTVDPIMGFKTHSEYLFDDLKKITQVDSEVSQLVSKFLNYKATRKPE
ncbi:MAG: hypothetical protein RR877_00110 [Aurantimicrobium sp.]